MVRRSDPFPYNIFFYPADLALTLFDKSPHLHTHTYTHALRFRWKKTYFDESNDINEAMAMIHGRKPPIRTVLANAV